MNVLPSGLRMRNSWRLTRKTKATCRVNVQHCALRRRQPCRNSSSWRRTLPGRCTDLHYWELLPQPSCSLCLICFNQHPRVLIYTILHNFFLSSFTYWTQFCFASGSLRAQNTELKNSLGSLEQTWQEMEKSQVALQLQHQQDSTTLQTQLDEADSRSKALQREVRPSKVETSTLGVQYLSGCHADEYFYLKCEKWTLSDLDGF